MTLIPSMTNVLICWSNVAVYVRLCVTLCWGKAGGLLETPGTAYTPASAACLEGENGTNGRSWRGKGYALVFLVPNCSSQVNYGIWLD